MAGHEPLYFACVVAAAGEWCADHLEEAQLLFAHGSVGLELLRGDKAVDGQVANDPKCPLLIYKNQKIARNDRCEATGKKFKNCCGAL